MGGLWEGRPGPIRDRGETPLPQTPLPQDIAILVGGPSRPDSFLNISRSFGTRSCRATCLGSEHVSPTSFAPITERSVVQVRPCVLPDNINSPTSSNIRQPVERQHSAGNDSMAARFATDQRRCGSGNARSSSPGRAIGRRFTGSSDALAQELQRSPDGQKRCQPTDMAGWFS